MNNLSMSMKKFFFFFFTVTIIGVLLCLVILWFGYNYRINQKVALVKLPYATTAIQPRTLITDEMVGYIEVPIEFLGDSKYYNSKEDIVGKYSNYNTMIAKGSLFYTDLVTEESSLPNSAFYNIKNEDTPINYKVNMDTTYANSMMPGDYINIYFKGQDANGNILFGKFISNIEILAVKDAQGRHVFDSLVEARTPAYMLFALPEDLHLLFRKALYLESVAGVEITLVPNTTELTEEDEVFISSNDIKNFIEERTNDVDISKILSETADKVGNSDTNTNTNVPAAQ